VGVQEVEAQADGDADGRVEEEFAQADFQIAEAQAQVESYAVELAEYQEGVDSGVEQ